jgi:hypothetical protein
LVEDVIGNIGNDLTLVGGLPIGLLTISSLGNPSFFFHHCYVRKVSGMKTPQQSKIPIPEFKKLLGSAASGLSDSEISHLRDWEDRLADIVFDSWLRNRNPQPGVANLPE